jgi:hypothetical protein
MAFYASRDNADEMQRIGLFIPWPAFLIRGAAWQVGHISAPSAELCVSAVAFPSFEP